MFYFLNETKNDVFFVNINIKTKLIFLLQQIKIQTGSHNAEVFCSVQFSSVQFYRKTTYQLNLFCKACKMKKVKITT